MAKKTGKPKQVPNKSRRGFLLGPLQRIKQNVDELRGTEPEDAGPPPEFVVARAAMRSGELDKAVAFFRDGLKQAKDDMDARRDLGVCLYKTGKLVNAKVEFERILKTDPQDNDSLLHLGLIHARQGRAERALDYWRDYYCPKKVRVQREVNLQIALADSGDEPDGPAMAQAVEQAMNAADGPGQPSPLAG